MMGIESTSVKDSLEFLEKISMGQGFLAIGQGQLFSYNILYWIVLKERSDCLTEIKILNTCCVPQVFLKDFII